MRFLQMLNNFPYLQDDVGEAKQVKIHINE